MTISDEMNEAQEQTISLIHDPNARDIFSNSSLPQLWCKMVLQYPDIAHFALKLFVLFPSIYFCETAFSSLLMMKSKTRDHLDVEPDLRCCLSTTQ